MKGIEMKITQDISNALKAASEDMGGLSEMERRTGVSKANLSRYLSGKTLSMNDNNWGDILPYLKFYLPKDAYDAYVKSTTVSVFTSHAEGRFNLETGEKSSSSGNESKIIPLSEDKDFKQKEELAYALFNKKKMAELSNGTLAHLDPGKLFPIVSSAVAAEVNTAYYPMAQYAQENAEEYQYFPDGKDGDFVIRVQGDSMDPWYPPGTLLLVRNTRPENGKRVIAILEGGEVIFKVFVQKGEKVGLLSINRESGENLIFPPHKMNEIRGIYRVIASVRNEEKLDAAMNQSGILHFWQEELKNM